MRDRLPVPDPPEEGWVGSAGRHLSPGRFECRMHKSVHLELPRGGAASPGKYDHTTT